MFVDMLRNPGFLLCLGVIASSTEELTMKGQGLVQQPACSSEQKLECGDKFREFGGCGAPLDANVYRQLAEVADGICITACNIDVNAICRGTDGDCSDWSRQRCARKWVNAGACGCPDDCDPQRVIAAVGMSCIKCPNIVDSFKEECRRELGTPSPTFAESLVPTFAPTNAESPRPTVAPTRAPSPSPTPAPTNTKRPSPCKGWRGSCPPTHSPTPAPIVFDSPTSAPIGFDSPTPAPTVSETEFPAPTVAPTNAPSPSQTPAPTNAKRPSPCKGWRGSCPPTRSPTPAPIVAETPRPTVQELADCVIEGKRFKGRVTKRKAEGAVECWEKCQASSVNGKQCKGWSWVEGAKKPCRLYNKNKKLKTGRGFVTGKKNCHPTLGQTDNA